MGKIMNVTLGADPEVFVYAENIQMLVSSIGIVGGSKEVPKALSEPGFFVQEDNVLAEFNIPPAESKKDFVAAIFKGRELIKEVLPPNYSTIIKSSHTFYPEQLEDFKAKEFGCDPDYNAWTNKRNPIPDAKKFPLLRSSGGHIHVGYKDSDHSTNIAIIRMLDAYLGVPSVIIDTDKDRRKLYGKAGAFRDKPYGVEYRTLSSFWLADEQLTGWVYDNSMLALERVNNGDTSIVEHSAFIVDAINQGDHNAAKLFVEQYNIPLPAQLSL
jgi:hypothetical protein